MVATTCIINGNLVTNGKIDIIQIINQVTIIVDRDGHQLMIGKIFSVHVRAKGSRCSLDVNYGTTEQVNSQVESTLSSLGVDAVFALVCTMAGSTQPSMINMSS